MDAWTIFYKFKNFTEKFKKKHSHISLKGLKYVESKEPQSEERQRQENSEIDSMVIFRCNFQKIISLFFKLNLLFVFKQLLRLLKKQAMIRKSIIITLYG